MFARAKCKTNMAGTKCKKMRWSTKENRSYILWFELDEFTPFFPRRLSMTNQDELVPDYHDSDTDDNYYTDEASRR